MDVTDVNVFLVDEDRLKAYVSIVLDGCFIVRDMKIIKGRSGLFVAMPSRKRKDGTYCDVAHPLNAEFRLLIEEKVFKEYEAELGKKNLGANKPK